ncbi:hypothetical protein M3Y94_00622600 [Aphelenchoides besseyi]|nr:hypothetical protein M3Y94_00622600 [Aphelenchoides besseyi]KAI6218940.1 hypothetical protein M3Y95_01141600 [Aphelenchoides besseyi]
MMVDKTSEAQITFKTSDGHTIVAAPNFDRYSILLSDIVKLQLEGTMQPIELVSISSEVLNHINDFLKNLNANCSNIPIDASETEWQVFTNENLVHYLNWSRDTSSEMLISIANAAQYLQMDVAAHYALACLSDRCNDLNIDDMRILLQENDDMDDEMKSQIEDLKSTVPDFDRV